MAKWGEGDPRWIVEERPDATNVNNWHWTEKNASQWSKDKLGELLGNLEIEDEVGACAVVEISQCEGEAVVNNRKAKLIFFYEWSIILKWQGTVKGSDELVKGKIEIPNLSEEHEPADVDVTVTLEENTEEAETLKTLLRTKGEKVIREKLEQYIISLKKEFSQGMILPTKGEKSSSQAPKTTGKVLLNNSSAKEQVNGIRHETNKSEPGVKIDTSRLTLTESFKCTAEELYRSLTIPEMVQAFTQGPCILEAEKGGKFQLFGGNVCGTFSELVPSKKICQKWRFKSWPDGHHSDVVIDIVQKEESTDINLTQTGIPQNDLERTRDGWKRYYWDSMKRTFGFGAMLF